MTNEVDRRQFLSTSTAAVAPLIAPSSIFGPSAPSNRITLGCIGLRGMGNYNIQEFLKFDDCRIVVLCDVDREVLENSVAAINDFYGNTDCRSCADYRELLARADIDAVLIATPDHWHAPIGIAAARAGKDIYCEKPITHTHAEGKKLVAEVREHERIWQTGSWQRSQWPFRQAAEVVRNGLLGQIKHIEIGLPSGEPFPPDNGDFTPPATVDYDMWCGPSPVLPFHPQRFHGNWRWNYAYGGGQLMDWIGHHNDVAHWALGEDLGGPIAVEMDEFRRPLHAEVWDAAWRYGMTCTYKSGVVTRITNRARQGITFYGSDGWLHISRAGLQASREEWTREGFEAGSVKLAKSDNHWRNFLDSVKSRQPTVTPAEIAHRSITPGHLGMIAAEIGARIEWDPEKEQIIDNEAAAKLLNQQGDKMPWLPWREQWAEPLLT